jgi:folylpolyglutamate synthase/dihydropteroate synthase
VVREAATAALHDPAASASGPRVEGAAAPGPAPPVVETVAEPHAALARARELAGAGGSVLVAGSLYLLEDLRDVLEGGH